MAGKRASAERPRDWNARERMGVGNPEAAHGSLRSRGLTSTQPRQDVLVLHLLSVDKQSAAQLRRGPTGDLLIRTSGEATMARGHGDCKWGSFGLGKETLL